MPQGGLHGLVGLALVRTSSGRIPRRVFELAAVGLMLGAVFPDADLYPTSIAYLLGYHDAIGTMHRTFTHSIFLILAIGVASIVTRKRDRCWFYAGLAIGLCTHDLLDIFLWFSPVDLFWPLSHFPPDAPWLPVINLWRNFVYPPIFGLPDFIPNVLGAAELAAAALWLHALAAMAAEASLAPADVRLLRKWQTWAWISFIINLVGAVMLKGMVFQILITAQCLLIFYPFCWLKSYQVVCAWSRNAGPA